MKISAFLPCRQGSQRVPQKNIKPFSEHHNGLLEIKLNQLLNSTLINDVVLSTNDHEIIKYAAALNHPRLIVHHRCEELASNDTRTDDLIIHATDLITSGHILWTHVTSPFVNSTIYDSVIRAYKHVLNQGYDSLMSVTDIHGFLWDKSGPINYDRSIEKWPRTQTISPLHEINSAVFLSSVDNYRVTKDRIGNKPFLYPMDKLQGFDIDWPEDFSIAECMLEKGMVTI